MNFNISQKIKYIKSAKDNKHLVAAFVILIFVSIYVSHQQQQEILVNTTDTVRADTIIPKGYILYPIRLENIDAIKGVIDQYGVIDVYGWSKHDNKSAKILSKIKILQAPYNPNEYALLLPEALSQKMMSESGPFLGVIQNKMVAPDLTLPTAESKIQKINIEYQGGS